MFLFVKLGEVGGQGKMIGATGQVIGGTAVGKMEFGDFKAKSHGKAHHAGTGIHFHLLSSFVIVSQV